MGTEFALRKIEQSLVELWRDAITNVQPALLPVLLPEVGWIEGENLDRFLPSRMKNLRTTL
jgi:hypothetical protein